MDTVLIDADVLETLAFGTQEEIRALDLWIPIPERRAIRERRVSVTGYADRIVIDVPGSDCRVECALSRYDPDDGRPRRVALEIDDARAFDRGVAFSVFRAEVRPEDVGDRDRLAAEGCVFEEAVRLDGLHLGEAVLRASSFERGFYAVGTAFSDGSDFDMCGFPWDADFRGARFLREARFASAVFGGGARFDDAEFMDAVSFGPAAAVSGTGGTDPARFDMPTSFDGARFLKDARFEDASFICGVSFTGARFSGRAFFGRVSGRVPPSYVNVGFRDARFESDVEFREMEFLVACAFEGMTCGGDLIIERVYSSPPLGIGWIRVAGSLRISDVHGIESSDPYPE